MKDEQNVKETSTVKIDGATYASMVVSAANSIHNQKEAINELNVFPVPDGDTGINMSMTMSPAAEFTNYSGTISDCAEKVASSLLRAARGNSGVILSLFFRGIAKGFAGKETVATEIAFISSKLSDLTPKPLSSELLFFITFLNVLRDVL